jgi:hypothetical protein
MTDQMTAPQSTPSVPTMPQGGHEKFYDRTTGAYNWQAHAVEAEFRLAQGNKYAAPEQPAPQQPQPTQTPADVYARAAAELKAGALTAETKLALASAGATPEFISSLEGNAQAATVAAEAEAYTHLGGNVEAGKAVWAQIETWAKANLSEAERTQYAALLGQPGWKAALDTLKARAGIGSQPTLLSGGVPGAAQAQPFGSLEEQNIAINKPHPDNPRKRLYDIDPAYRQMVGARIVATSQIRKGV